MQIKCIQETFRNFIYKKGINNRYVWTSKLKDCRMKQKEGGRKIVGVVFTQIKAEFSFSSLFFIQIFQICRKGVVLAEKNLNENLETPHLNPTQYYHLSGFYLKTGFLRNHPLSLIKREKNIQYYFFFII